MRQCLMLLAGIILMLNGSGALALDKAALVEAVPSAFEQKLGLSPEQKEKIAVIRDSYRQRRDALRQELNASYEALRLELDADKVVKEKVDAALAEVKRVQGDLLDNRVDVVVKLRAVYTREQLRKIKEGFAEAASKNNVEKKSSKKPRKLETRK